MDLEASGPATGRQLGSLFRRTAGRTHRTVIGARPTDLPRTTLRRKKITHNTGVFGEYSVNNNQPDPADGPPEPDSGAVPGNLPPETASFVGRERELGLLSELLRGQRLVTL